MLSPGTHHSAVPKPLPENLRYRHALLELAEDPSVQAALVEMCSEDILLFINSFGWQINPKLKKGKIGPFITWDFQDQAILEVVNDTGGEGNPDEDDDILWEKSRDMGATWMALFIADWSCLFHDWTKYLFISHSEQAVYRAGDPDSLFWKVQFMHDHTPDFITRGVIDRKLSFEYPATHAAMNGAANSERAGVGGRNSRVVLDEFSKHPAAAEIWGQTADTGPRLVIGTHYGVDGTFHTLAQRTDMRKRQMHWTQHPRKNPGLYRFNDRSNKVEVIDKSYDFGPYEFVRDPAPLGGPFPGVRSPWYDREVRRRKNERDVAMHLDINAQGSQFQFFDPLQVRVLVAEYAREPSWIGDISYDPQTGKPDLGLHPTAEGPLWLWMNLKDGKPPEGRYVAGGDLSYGVGATPSCFSIANAKTGEKVARYLTSRKTPEELAPIITAICWLFQDFYGRPALLVWETPGPGIQFGRAVVDLDYTNIWFRVPLEGFGSKPVSTPGWVSQPKTKENLLGEYQAALYSRRFINHDEESLDQCLQYRYNKQGKGIEHPADQGSDDPRKARQNHGDLVIGDALCWMLCKDMDLMDEEKRLVVEGPPYMSLAWRRGLREHEAEEYSYE